MRKSVIYIVTLSVLLLPVLGNSQTTTSSINVLVEEQNRLIDNIKATSNDSDVISKLTRFIESKVQSISRFIRSSSISDIEKEKASRSFVYFMEEVREKSGRQKTDIYDIPTAFDAYEKVLRALLAHKPFNGVVMSLPPRSSQFLATAFSQYDEYSLLNDIAIYKRVASAPDFILRFLEDKPSFRYSDSLLLIAATHDPLKFTVHLQQDNKLLRENSGKINNIYFQQIVSMAGNKNASELLPFIVELAENRITADSILKTRMDVTKYFQLLVNTLIESRKSDRSTALFQKVLRDGIRKKAMMFYVNEINELHNAKEAVRFASVKALRPEDLYYIITTGGEDLYTSSYLGLYKRLMQAFKNQTADSLFSIVQFDNFRTFMRLAANYNTQADFLSNMPPESAAILVKRFVSGIEADPTTGLEKAMDVADSFTGLDTSAEISAIIERELNSNLRRCQSTQQYLGIRLYKILLEIFDLVKQKDSFEKLSVTLGNYEMLTNSSLRNRNGEIVELALFYGDADGIASFNNFQKQFADRKWEIKKNAAWMSFRSVSGQPLVIYANLPLDNTDELDLRAQDSLVSFLEQQSIAPTVLIHRGHSYHLPNTLKRLTPSVRLAILGSCGAYNSAISIATVNPDVQIISSKKMGSKTVNDPIIDVVNETLLNGQDLSWPEIWNKLQTRFRKDEFALNLFNEYIPPGKNVGLFVLKLFNYYNNAAPLVVASR